MLCGRCVYSEFSGLSDPVRAGLYFRQIQTSHSFALRLPSRLFVKKSLPLSSRINYLFRVWGEPQSFLSPHSIQLSTSLLLPLILCGSAEGEITRQVSGGSLRVCFQVLVFLKTPRWGVGYICPKWGRHSEKSGDVLFGKGTKDPPPKPADQWEDVQRPDLMEHSAMRRSEPEPFDTWAL